MTSPHMTVCTPDKMSGADLNFGWNSLNKLCIRNYSKNLFQK